MNSSALESRDLGLEITTLHKINNYFRFRYYHRLDYVSVHPPLLDGSSIAAAVGDYIAEA